MSFTKKSLYKFILAAMFLALAMVLPFFTGQIPQIGKMLCPMHIPVLLCGFFCGPALGAMVGVIAPLLRSVLFAFPPLMPNAVVMAFELAAYGFMTGFLYKLLPKKNIYVYVTLIVSMLAGRVVYGAVSAMLMLLGKTDFGWAAFFAGAFINAIPGIILHIILIPMLVMALKRYTYSGQYDYT